MGLVGAADGVGAGLAKAEVAHLALFHQPRHGADGVLDRHGRVDAVDVIKVDDLDAETLEAGVTGDRRVIRLAVDAAALPTRPADVAEFRGDQILVAPPLDGRADELFVDAGGIGVGSVEHGDAKLGRLMDGRDRLHVVGHAVVGAHARATEPDR